MAGKVIFKMTCSVSSEMLNPILRVYLSISAVVMVTSSYTIPNNGCWRFHIRSTCISQLGVLNLFHIHEMVMGDPSIPLPFRLTVVSEFQSTPELCSTRRTGSKR